MRHRDGIVGEMERMEVDGEVIEAKQFCSLGDKLERGGGAERAIRTRVSAMWKKWREMAGFS